MTYSPNPRPPQDLLQMVGGPMDGQSRRRNRIQFDADGRHIERRRIGVGGIDEPDRMETVVYRRVAMSNGNVYLEYVGVEGE